MSNKLFGKVTQTILQRSSRNIASFIHIHCSCLIQYFFPKDYPVFRCTNSKVTVQPSPYLSYRLPKDFVDLSTGEDVHKLIDFLKLVRSTKKKFWPSMSVKWQHQSAWNCAFVVNTGYTITERVMYEAMKPSYNVLLGWSIIFFQVTESKLSYWSHFS